MKNKKRRLLSPGELLQLQRLSTPTLFNGWEQITKHDAAREAFNLEEVRDFMPQFGPMAGYAVTVVCEPGNPRHKRKAGAFLDYYRHVAAQPGPKIVVVQDLDKPRFLGAFWGEVNASVHKALGCVGAITDGAIRDLTEMTAVGFKALAQRLCVGHAHSWPVRWGVEVKVFGRAVRPGQLIHADQHGFLVVPDEDVPRLLESARFMDANECNHLISAARGPAGRTAEEILAAVEQGWAGFQRDVFAKFRRRGEY